MSLLLFSGMPSDLKLTKTALGGLTLLSDKDSNVPSGDFPSSPPRLLTAQE